VRGRKRQREGGREGRREGGDDDTFFSTCPAPASKVRR
jgi:hypothetical protein